MTDWNDDAPDVDPHAATEWGLDAVDGSVAPTSTRPLPQPQPQPHQQAPYQPMQPVQRHTTAPLQMSRSMEVVIEEGRTFAILSHIGTVLGVPLFLIPLLQRDNEFAMHHAKAAAVTYASFILLGTIFLSLYMCTCGFGLVLFPVVLLPFVPLIAGVIDASNGRRASRLALGDLGERVLGGLQPRNNPPPPPQLR